VGRWHKVNALLLRKLLARNSTPLPGSPICRSAKTPLGPWPLRAGVSAAKSKNQGFNLQKNSGLNLEHAYSNEPDVLKAFYYLLQIAHLFLQMFEMGSLLQHFGQRVRPLSAPTVRQPQNLNQRLLECFRYFPLGEEAFATVPCQIRLLDSS